MAVFARFHAHRARAVHGVDVVVDDGGAEIMRTRVITFKTNEALVRVLDETVKKLNRLGIKKSRSDLIREGILAILNHYKPIIEQLESQKPLEVVR